MNSRQKLEKSFIFIGLTEEQEEQISQYVKADTRPNR